MRERKGYLLIEVTDEYFCESKKQWLPVPRHWIGESIKSVDHEIRNKQKR